MKRLILCIYFGFITSLVWSQDHYFTQAFADPISDNPAFAGSTSRIRLSGIYRSQWPSSKEGYQRFNFAYDQHIKALHGGIAIFVTQDKTAADYSPVNTNTIGLAYNYLINPTQALRIRIGLKLSYNEQIIPYPKIYNPAFAEESYTQTYFDICPGAVFYGRDFYVGIGVNHLLEPYVDSREGFIDNYRKYVWQFGISRS